MVAAVRSKLGSLGAEFVRVFEGKRVRRRELFIGGRLGRGVKKSVRIGDISGQFELRTNLCSFTILFRD
jgi:hypothetical protein